ncbi:cytochrome c5 family protein [Pseudomonas fluorescens]
MNLIMKMLAAPATVLALWAVSAQAATNDEIAKRLEPVGQVCVQGQECKGMEVAVAVGGGGGAKTPDEVIAKHCNACHGSGLLNAPKIGDTAAWKERLGHVDAVLAELKIEDPQKGTKGLAQVAKHGLNAMPPMGTCADCSLDDLEGAIKKMSGL